MARDARSRAATRSDRTAGGGGRAVGAQKRLEVAQDSGNQPFGARNPARIARERPDITAIEAQIGQSAVAEQIELGDIVVMQGNLSPQATATCLELARRRGASTLLNPSPLPAEAGPALPPADIVIVNEGEARALTRCEDPDQAAMELLRQGAGIVLVTLGPRGCLIAENRTGNIRRLPAPAVNAVDTSGAGDVFCGIFAGGIDLGMTPAEAASLAIAAAAIAVGRDGTSESCPSRAEIRDLIRTLETEKP